MADKTADQIAAELQELEEAGRALAARKKALALQQADLDKFRNKVEIPMPAIRDQLMSYAVFLRTKAMGEHLGALENAVHLPTSIAEVRAQIEATGAAESNNLRPLVEWLELLESDRFMGNGPHTDTSYKLVRDAVVLARNSIKAANGGDVGDTVRRAIDEAYDQIAFKAASGKGPYSAEKGYDFVSKEATDFDTKLKACEGFMAKTQGDLKALQEESCARLIEAEPKAAGANVGWDGRQGKDAPRPKSADAIMTDLKDQIEQAEKLFDFAKTNLVAKKSSWRSGKETMTVAEAEQVIAPVFGNRGMPVEVTRILTRLAKSSQPMQDVSAAPMGTSAFADTTVLGADTSHQGTAVAVVDRGAGTDVAKR